MGKPLSPKKLKFIRLFLMATNAGFFVVSVLFIIAGLYINVVYDSPDWTWPVFAMAFLAAGLGFFGFFGLFYSKTSLFMYMSTMFVICMYSFFSVIILSFGYSDKADRYIGDNLDMMYKSLAGYRIKEEEINSLTRRYTRMTTWTLILMFLLLVLGTYFSYLLLGFRKVVKRFMQSVNLVLLGCACVSAVLASYVYDTEVFRSDGDQFLVVILFLVCIALGGTALTGMWAVRRENAKVMRMHFIGELVILGMLFLIGSLAVYYKNSIPEHLQTMYKEKPADWERLFGYGVSYEDVEESINANIFTLITICSVIFDALFLSIAGNFYINRHSKDDDLSDKFMSPEELLPEQLASKIDSDEAKENRLAAAVDSALLHQEVNSIVTAQETQSNPVFGGDFT